MRLPTRVGLLAGASALAATGASFADNTETQDQAARIAELESQVAKLTGDDWLTEERAEEIRGVVQDVLADADTRASLLQSGMSAGYDDGFVIGSSDGNFSLKMNGQLQARFIYNNQDDGTASFAGPPPFTIANTDDSNRWGFENTRTKLIFTGNVAGPQWGYRVEGNFDRDGGDFELEDAYIVYDAGNGWSLKMGQFKNPLNREYLVDSADQLLIERSTVSYLYNGGRTQGVEMGYATDQWRLMTSYNDGLYTANTAWSTYDTEHSFTGRFEFLFMGNWGQFDDFTSPRGSEQGLMAGIGVHWSKWENGVSFPDNKLTTVILSGDISWEADGWNVYGNVNYSDFDNDASSGDPDDIDVSPIGFVVHGGYYFTDRLEGYARYEYNDFDTMSGPGDIDDLSLLTIGVNHYYNDNVKASADIGYGFDAVTTPTTITGARTDAAGDDGQIILRTQLQLTF